MCSKAILACGLAAWLAGVVVTIDASPVPAGPQVVSSSSTGGSTSIFGIEAQQAPMFGTGVISGVITDATTGAPLENAFVSLGGGRPGPAGRPQQMTDARGRFMFTHLAAANYTLSAVKLGFLDGGYKRVPGVSVSAPITLRDGEWFPRADVQLWKTASIAGTVIDDQNDPVVGVPVRVLMKINVAGRSRYASGPSTTTDDRGMYRLAGLSAGEYVVHVPSVQVTVPASTPAPRPPAASGTSITSAAPDPDGILRTEGGQGLYVGFYATPPAGGGAAAYPMAFHPASRTLESATAIALGYGDQRQNVDVQLTLVPTVRVSGRVLGPDASIAKLPVRLVPLGSEGLALGAEAALTTTDAAGAFTFLRVPSGDYTVMASRTTTEFSTGGGVTTPTLIPRSVLMITSMSVSTLPGLAGMSLSTRSTEGDLRLSGRTILTVGDRDLDDVVVPLVTGVTVSGHFLWDGAEAPPANMPLNPNVRLESADGDPSLVVRRTGAARGPADVVPGPVALSIEGVPPGQYVFGSVSAGNFTLESIEWRGRDLIASPLEVDGDRDITGVVIRLTSKPTTVTGSVSSPSGPATSGVVIAFPAAPAQWRNHGLSALQFRTAPVDSKGGYTLTQLVPGDYLLAGVPDEDRFRWTDPEYLAAISGAATRVTVTPGAKLTQSLRMLGSGR